MAPESHFEIGLGLENTHVMVTGGAGQIGSVIVEAFLAAGACVTALDLLPSKTETKNSKLLSLQADVTDEKQLRQAFEEATQKFGTVSICVAAAGLDLSFIPHHSSICDLPLGQWQRTLSVNATGTFLTAQNWLRGIRDYAHNTTRNVSLIIIGSEAGTFGVPGNADYASSKAAIQFGLTRSLAPEATKIFNGARVNAIAPGPVNTPQFQKECAENQAVQYQEYGATTALRSSVPMEAVGRLCLMLASENYSSHITGQIISVDGGKSGALLWTEAGPSKW